MSSEISTSSHLKVFTSAALPQEMSPLFASLPGEIRDRIFSFALADYEDKRRAYNDTTCYKRPNHLAPLRIDTSLLRTCQRIYREAWFIPWAKAEHTFWLTDIKRMPPNALARHRLCDALRNAAENVRRTHGEVPTIDQIRIFAQLWLLEPGIELSRLLSIPHFQPLHVTITLRHTDWWYWEQDEVLRINAEWVEKCRFPLSVKSVRMELESLERKKSQVDSLAEQMARHWQVARADGVKFEAASPSPSDVMRWSGTSAWGDERWLRDETRPGQLDYYVAAVIWTVPKVTTRSALETKNTTAPALHAVGQSLEPSSRPQVSLSRLQAANIGFDVPAHEVMSKLHAWLARPRAPVHYARDIDYGEDSPEPPVPGSHTGRRPRRGRSRRHL